jgi:hypothetical protein
MDLSSIGATIKELIQTVWEKGGDLVTSLAPLREMILSHFGQPGLVATYIALGVIGLLITYRLVKITFAVVKYLVVPAVVLAFVGTLVLPYSFAFLLPITVSVCSLILLAKA